MDSIKIMVVEDNTIVAEDCRECLQDLGFSITSIVASGEESIEKAELERPDAVLMDIHLRDKMDGIEAAEQIYSRFNIPVVFLTAYNDRELLERAKRVGSFGYLIKPFEERELYTTLEMALYKAKTEQERKKAETVLNMYKRIIDSSASNMSFLDSHYVYQAVNDSYLVAYGKSREEIVGHSVAELMDKEVFEDLIKEKIDRCLAGEIIRYEAWFDFPETGKIYMDVAYHPYSESGGPVSGVIVVAHDITERKNSETMLAEKTLLLDSILQNAQDIGIITMDLDFRLTYINPLAEKFSGYRAEIVIGKTMQEIHAQGNIPPDLFKWVLEKVQEHGEYNFSFTQESDDGVRTIESTLSVIYNQAGETTGFLLFSRDVTEWEQSQKMLLEASRMEATATLAAGIAHGFNNLMVGVLGNADLLKMQFDATVGATDKLNAIMDSACKAGELVQQLLAFARSGKYQPEIMNLNTTVQETLRLNERSFTPNVRIKWNTDPDLNNIEADRAQMNQVVMNLCINAVEAITKSGRIIISTRNMDIDEEFVAAHPSLKVGPHVCLSVEDTGCGMDQKTLAKAFEPFFSTKFQGRGLGLAAVYGIVKNHGGYISARSEIGKGTAFEIYLPAVESEMLPEPKSTGSFAHQGNETILIIDDEKMILKVTREILEGFGYRILQAENGQDGVDLAQSFDGEIHLAILDMGMPVMDGAEAFPLLKEARPKMKVLLCSGYDLDSAAQSLIEAGADAFIKKPFRAEQIAREIRNALDNDKQEE